MAGTCVTGVVAAYLGRIAIRSNRRHDASYFTSRPTHGTYASASHWARASFGATGGSLDSGAGRDVHGRHVALFIEVLRFYATPSSGTARPVHSLATVLCLSLATGVRPRLAHARDADSMGPASDATGRGPWSARSRVCSSTIQRAKLFGARSRTTGWRPSNRAVYRRRPSYGCATPWQVPCQYTPYA